MKNDKWLDDFITILHEKYPKNSDLLQALTNLLGIDRMAAYRRLRKDVLFTINEIITIATTWNISLDEISSICSNQIAFQMKRVNFLNPSEEEEIFLKEVIKSINYLKDFDSTEFMDICNKIPRKLLTGYEHLYKYYLFKWLYQYGEEKEIVPLSQIIIPERKQKITFDYTQVIKNVPNTVLIFDKKIFDYLVSDINYFHAIQMISNNEKNLIKQNLHDLIDYLLEISSKGYYPETKRKVDIYISQLNIDTNYSYTFTPISNICFVQVFEKYEIYSFNSEMVANFRTWMQFKKRSSIKISDVDEKTRITFFNQQRQFVDEL